MAKLYILVSARRMAGTRLQLIPTECTVTASTTECRRWRRRLSCSAWMLVNRRKMESLQIKKVVSVLINQFVVLVL